MRAVVQRVAHARVDVGEERVAEMPSGLLALVGVAHDDGDAQAAWLADKLVHLRIFGDSDGRMNRSLLDVGGTLGVVSQFTLLGDARRGRRPSFAEAAEPAHAEARVAHVVSIARELGAPVVTGRFGAHMRVELSNDGPVTLVIDTPT